MASFDPYRQGESEGSIPQAQPLSQAAPLEADGVVPRAEPIPQVARKPAGVQPVLRTQPASPGQVARPGSAAQPMVARPVAVKTDSSRPLVYQREEDEEESQEELTSIAIKHAPPWLISAAFHMGLLIVLGLCVLAAGMGGDEPELEVSTDDQEDIWAEELGDQTEYDFPMVAEMEAIQKPELAISDLPPVENPFAAPPELEIQPDGQVLSSELNAKIPGLALSGREEGSKRALLGKYGGTRKTEEAVLAGLRWLARQQRSDGSWSLAGPYSDGVRPYQDNPAAATALALIAFQGNGSTHKKGRFRENVVRGWNWLKKQEDSDGNFYHEGLYRQQFYTQGLCTIAICELYGMTQDPKYKDPAERAVKFCLDSQSPEGGWRYNPKGGSDVSVTGWIVMALQSAKMAGLEVPEDHFTRIMRFLDNVQDPAFGGSRYPYLSGESPTRSMTAEALLCRQYLGWDRDDERLVEGVDWITHESNLIDYGDRRDDHYPRQETYFWYYATQVAHHMEGRWWKRWNEVMREEVPRHQVQNGREAGSWDPNKSDVHENGGGRLYSTCLQIYMLEVYYRHLSPLSIYRKVYSDLKKSGRTDRF